MSNMVDFTLKVGIVFTLGSFLALAQSESCRSGWIHYHNSCYLFSKSVSDWAGSGFICSKLDSKLVEVESGDEDHFIQTTLQSFKNSASYWNGMNDIEVEGEFRWLDSDKTLSFTHWNPTQPEVAPTQNCGIFWSATGYDWHDFHCEQAHNFICEKELEVAEIIG